MVSFWLVWYARDGAAERCEYGVRVRERRGSPRRGYAASGGKLECRLPEIGDQ